MERDETRRARRGINRSRITRAPLTADHRRQPALAFAADPALIGAVRAEGVPSVAATIIAPLVAAIGAESLQRAITAALDALLVAAIGAEYLPASARPGSMTATMMRARIMAAG